MLSQNEQITIVSYSWVVIVALNIVSYFFKITICFVYGIHSAIHPSELYWSRSTSRVGNITDTWIARKCMISSVIVVSY